MVSLCLDDKVSEKRREKKNRDRPGILVKRTAVLISVVYEV